MIDPDNQSGHRQYYQGNTDKFVEMEEVEGKYAKDRRQSIEYITDLPGVETCDT